MILPIYFTNWTNLTDFGKLIYGVYIGIVLCLLLYMLHLVWNPFSDLVDKIKNKSEERYLKRIQHNLDEHYKECENYYLNIPTDYGLLKEINLTDKTFTIKTNNIDKITKEFPMEIAFPKMYNINFGKHIINKYLMDLNFKDCFITNSSTDFNNISYVEFKYNEMPSIQFIN